MHCVCEEASGATTLREVYAELADIRVIASLFTSHAGLIPLFQFHEEQRFLDSEEKLWGGTDVRAGR